MFSSSSAKIKARVISRTQKIKTAHGVMFLAVILNSTSCIHRVRWGSAYVTYAIITNFKSSNIMTIIV
jgi:hypothetical protein